jgi:hypothetical protein
MNDMLNVAAGRSGTPVRPSSAAIDFGRIARPSPGAYLISLCTGTALFGMFFFLTLFIQDVWGYSALKTGLAYLPFVPVILVMTVVAQRVVTLIGARPLLIAGGGVPGEGDLVLAQVPDHLARARGACYIGSGAGSLPGPRRGGGEQQVQGGQVRHELVLADIGVLRPGRPAAAGRRTQSRHSRARS